MVFMPAFSRSKGTETLSLCSIGQNRKIQNNTFVYRNDTVLFVAGERIFKQFKIVIV